MNNSSKEFDNLIQTLLKSKLQSLGHQFDSQDAFDTFVKDHIHIHNPEETNLQHFYLGKPNGNGILLFTYKKK